MIGTVDWIVAFMLSGKLLIPIEQMGMMVSQTKGSAQGDLMNIVTKTKKVHREDQQRC